MGSDFPVPRDKLPRLDVSPLEREARKAQMERILQHALDEYDHFREVEQGRVDPKTWKLAETREGLQLFRERRAGSGAYSGSVGGAGAGMPTPSSHSATSDEERASLDSHFDASSAAALAQSKSKSMMLVGETPGRVESAVFAALTKSYEELALVSCFLNDDAADVALLKMMEGPTPEQPLQFLGYKWFARKSPGGGRLVKHRDSLYLESGGVTQNKDGEDIGYLLMESVDLPGFPEMPERNCVRALLSVQFIVRQKTENTMDVFMRGVVDPAGKMGRFASMLTSDNAFMVARLMELAEAKRLTKMILTQRQARDDAMYNRRFKPTACSLCHQQRKFYNGVSLVDCGICGHVVCTRCRTHKRVFISDVNLGRFHRIGCCKTCVLAANQSRPNPTQMLLKVSISAQLQRQNSSRDFTNTVDSFQSSRHRSSSDSSMGTNEMFELQRPHAEFEDVSAIARPQAAAAAAQAAPATVSAVAVARRGSVEQSGAPGNVRRYGTGVTLLPASSTPRQQRREPQAFNTTGHSGSNNFALVALPETRRRGDSTSSIDSSSGRPIGSSTLNRPALELLPAATARDVSVPDYVSSAPAGAYDLRRNITAPQPASAQPAPRNDLFAQMMELRRLAESTYQTTQQNQAFMEQHQTTHQGGNRPQFP